MADDPLANIQQAQGAQDNADLNDAVRNNQWSNAFVNTPPADVLRSNLNLTSTMDRVINNRINLAAQTDERALNLAAATAKFKEYQAQAPLREALLQAHVDATGATNERITQEHILRANDTAGFNSDIADAYQRGLVKGTPEFEQTTYMSLAKHPHADQSHIQQLLKGEGPDGHPVNFENLGAEARNAHDVLVNQGVPEADIIYKTVGGHITASQRTTPTITDEQRVARERAIGGARVQTAVDKAAALQAANAARGPSPLDLQKRLSHLETLRSKTTDKDVRDYMDSEIKDVRDRLGGGIPAPVVPTPAGPAAVVPVTPSEQKALDTDTAKALLQETGGDKDKARELAKTRGFKF